MEERGLQRQTVEKLLKTYGVECRNFVYEPNAHIKDTYILPKPYYTVVSLLYNLPFSDSPFMLNGVTAIPRDDLLDFSDRVCNLQRNAGSLMQ